jgi:hypothetical protein
MFRPSHVLTAFALLALSGLAHGLWTGRWQPSDARDEALARVGRVPLTAGNWKGHDLEVDPAPFRQARAEAYWTRRYEDSKGRAVTVILMCGRSGPLAVHTPDVCYRGAGYEMAADPEPVEVRSGSGGPAHFWMARFQKEGPGAEGQLRLFWSWSTGGGPWLAADRPRLAFAGQPDLYKLYVISDLTTPDGPLAGDPALDLLRDLLPSLDRALAPAPAA